VTQRRFSIKGALRALVALRVLAVEWEVTAVVLRSEVDRTGIKSLGGWPLSHPSQEQEHTVPLQLLTGFCS